jgi:DNA-directed RNA polymerase subunit RPC12/RpoP
MICVTCKKEITGGWTKTSDVGIQCGKCAKKPATTKKKGGL